ncbi:MAG TPA: aminotransferase class V-fold PLP-dependent enzyme, partial [Chloroflexota bacterium]|nr:aminotransferase class V-fold PLP-dependent enzyme [Chloroflexota bacterium]
AVHLRPDAARFEAGNPGLLSAFVLENALCTLASFTREAILEHALQLGDALIEGLRARGRTIITPADPKERAGNICFLAADAPALAQRLADQDVLVWGSEGRVRVSAHLYNDLADLDRFFAALDAAG